MNEFKQLRTSLGLTQQAICDKLYNIPVRTWQDWENNRRTPPGWVIELIKYKLGVEVD